MKKLPFLPLLLLAANSCRKVTNAFKPIGDSPIGDGFYHYISDNFTGSLYHNFTKLGQEQDEQLQPSRVPMNHYTTIGMPQLLLGFEGIQPLLEAQGERFVNVPVPVGDDCFYNLCKSDSGAQLWGEVQTHQGRRVLRGFVPHFEGKSKLRVCLVTKNGAPWQFNDGTVSDKVLHGGYLAVWDHDDGVMDFLRDYTEEHEGEEGITLAQMVVKTDQGVILAGLGFVNPDTRNAYCAFNFDCPNFACLGRDTLHPIMATIQLAAFAREIKTFASVEEYYASLADKPDDMRLSSRFFGPSNCLDAADDSGYAFIVGHVIQAEKKTNELTGKSFFWALVRTAGDMEIDVVVDEGLPGAWNTEPPRVGGVVRVYGWLSGRLLSDSP